MAVVWSLADSVKACPHMVQSFALLIKIPPTTNLSPSSPYRLNRFRGVGFFLIMQWTAYREALRNSSVSFLNAASASASSASSGLSCSCLVMPCYIRNCYSSESRTDLFLTIISDRKAASAVQSR